MALADKAREAQRLANELHVMCVSKSVNLQGMDCIAAELRVLYPKWKWLPVVGVGFFLYIPFEDFKRVPLAIQHTASRIEGWSTDTGTTRAYVFKDRRSKASGIWIDRPTHPDWTPAFKKPEPPPTVWDRLGSDDEFGK